MIEIIRQTEKTEENLENKLPKNIRQIGNPEKDFRIYMEDYVYTYLHPAQINGIEAGAAPRLLILLGEIHHLSNRSCAFISGALQVENRALSTEVPELNEWTWRQVHKEIQQYFEGCEIVGWVLDIPGNTLEIRKEMEDIHRKNFANPYQFFFLMDSKEREEAFYIWKSGRLFRKEGYFIYYEKNPQMQEYMVSKREAIFGEKPVVEEVVDQAAKNYRAVMLEKRERTYKRRAGFISYVTSMLMVVVLCSISVILLQHIHKIESMEDSISVMSSVAMGTEAHQVDVETIDSTVLSLEEQEILKASAEEGYKEPTDETESTDTSIPTELMATSESEVSSESSATSESEAPSELSVPLESEAPSELSVPSESEASSESTAPTELPADATPKESAMSDAAQLGNTGAAEMYRAQGYYIVQEGDSLQQICYKIYQTNAMLGALCETNAIEDQNTIYVGQKIILP